MVHVALLTFLASGSFGPVALGVTRAELDSEFGPPDDVGGASRHQREPPIWRYGDVEFHFADDRLALIHIDRFSGPNAVPTAGRTIDLDPWLIARDASFLVVRHALDELALPVRLVLHPELDQTLISLPSGVFIGFSATIEPRLAYVSRR